MKYRKLLAIIALSGALAVGIGAFGAHGLKPYLDSYQIDIFRTGVQYQFYHTLAAAFAFLMYRSTDTRLLRWSIIAFLIGIFFFSGSLYILATREVIGLTNYRWVGPITPLGGLFFIAAWLMIAIWAMRK